MNGPTSIGSTLRSRKYSRIASFASTSTTQSSPTFSATRRSPLSSAATISSHELGCHSTSSRISTARAHSSSDGTSATPEVPLARGAEVRAGRDEDAVLEQPLGERLRGLACRAPRARGTSSPRCRRPECPSARRSRAGARACARSARARARRAPRRPRRRRRRAGRTPAAPSRPMGRNAFSAAISSGSPAAKPLRYPVIELALRERVEDDDVGPVARAAAPKPAARRTRAPCTPRRRRARSRARAPARRAARRRRAAPSRRSGCSDS